MNVTFRSLSEDKIGAAWKAVFSHGWPGWRSWYRKRPDAELVTLSGCRLMLRRHMPEMERTWDNLVSAAGGDEEVARFLSFWCPPRYLVGCSQLALADGDGPVLIRNYDLDPELNEATLLKSAWRGPTRVMGMVEGMAGLADGMNDCGLAVSLSFGGRIERGRGFGIPMIMRYVLETCRDTQDAIEAFDAVPCHMSYNITIIDRTGTAATLFLSPDRPIVVRPVNWATNHQLGVEWPHHGRHTRTEERDGAIADLVAEYGMNGKELARRFLCPPLHSSGYAEGFGTVYTAVYRPAQGSMQLAWGDGAFHEWRFDAFPHRTILAEFSEHGSRAEVVGETTPAPERRHHSEEGAARLHRDRTQILSRGTIH